MTEDTLPRFRVTLFICGSVSRPCYGSGTVDVFAVDVIQAENQAIRNVRENGYRDVSLDAFRVVGVERIG